MADDSALRATLKELKVVADSEEARRPVPNPKPTTPVSGRGGSSLLSDLLAETSGEAQRELDQIKQQLASKRAEAEELARQQEEQRRRQLDALRRQEADRREAMKARRTGAQTREQVDEVPADEGPAPSPAAAPPQKKSSNAILYVFGVLLLAGAGVGGWWFMGQQGDQRAVVTGSTAEIRAQARAEAEQTRAAAAAAAHAKARAEKAAAEAAATEHHTAMVSIVRSRTEPEAEGYPRRMLSLSLAVVEKPAVAKAGKPRKSGKAKKPGTRRPTGKRIKIRGLDLGGSR